MMNPASTIQHGTVPRARVKEEMELTKEWRKAEENWLSVGMCRTNALRRYNLSFYCAHPFLMELKIRLVSPKGALWLRGLGGGGGEGGKSKWERVGGSSCFLWSHWQYKMPQKHLVLWISPPVSSGQNYHGCGQRSRKHVLVDYSSMLLLQMSITDPWAPLFQWPPGQYSL